MRTGMLMLVSLAVVILVAAIAVPNLTCSRTASNETSAVASLVVILAGQSAFRQTDFYGIGEGVYANPVDGAGLVDLYELPDGTRVGLIDRSLAEALSGTAPKAGYYVAGVVCDDARTQFAACAAPASYARSGRNIFYMDERGTVYQMIAEGVYPGLREGDRVPPITRRLTSEQLSRGWIAVGSG